MAIPILPILGFAAPLVARLSMLAIEKALRNHRPVRFTVEWADLKVTFEWVGGKVVTMWGGGKVTVGISDDAEIERMKSVEKSRPKRPAIADTLEARLNETLKRALAVHGPEKASGEDRRHVLKQVQDGLAAVFSSLDAIDTAADAGPARVVDVPGPDPEPSGDRTKKNRMNARKSPGRDGGPLRPDSP